MSFDGRDEELTSLRRVAVEDAPGVIDAFRHAAKNTIDAFACTEIVLSVFFRVKEPSSPISFLKSNSNHAGFDGGELQGTNGATKRAGAGARWRWWMHAALNVSRDVTILHGSGVLLLSKLLCFVKWESHLFSLNLCLFWWDAHFFNTKLYWDLVDCGVIPIYSPTCSLIFTSTL